MYIPAHFRENRVSILQDAIRNIAVASLVTSRDGEIDANLFPLLLDTDPAPFGTLTGHMARANPQWQHVRSGDQALAIFLGPGAYVTPSWYPTKQQTGKVVPTWNYLMVHAYGAIEIFEGAAQLRTLVGALTRTHEASRAAPWAVSDAPADYVDQMLGAIVGFRFVISRLEGKWKMSQNRNAEDFAGVQAGLGAENIATADIMANLR